MKTCLLLVVFIAALFPRCASAQSGKEDVIYLKNGTIYRGTIIAQIPGDSYKIEILGGSVIVIPAGDVVKIIKEEKPSPSPTYYERPHKPAYEFHYRDRDYFFQAQALAQAGELGFRIVNGYKFGQFAYLGLGIGLDGVIADIHGNSDYGGAYFPVYVYYAGDIFRKHITPFYSLEAGYAFRPSLINQYAGYGTSLLGGHGGFMAGAGFGVRFYSRRRVHFDLSAHIDFKMAAENYADQAYANGITYTYYYTTNEVLIIPGLRFGVGF